MPELLRAIADQGYEQPTPIQAEGDPRDPAAARHHGRARRPAPARPPASRCRCCSFSRPQANTSLSPARHPTRVLILTPTRELAAQVEESVRIYGKYLPLRTAVVYGGVDIDPQIKALHAGVEILVATPGRLLDHLHQKTVNLSRVEFLVLDEADRMLDMGFMPDIKRILAVLPQATPEPAVLGHLLRTRCAGSRRSCCTRRSRSKSRRATRPPIWSRTRSTWCPLRASARC